MSDAGSEKEVLRETEEGPKLPGVTPIRGLHQCPLGTKGRWSKRRKAETHSMVRLFHRDYKAPAW